MEKKVAIIPGDYDYVMILESKTKKKKRFHRFEQSYTSELPKLPPPDNTCEG